MSGYLSTSSKSTFGFYLHQWTCLFLVDFLDSTFVTVTVLNSSMQKSFIEAPNHMISLKTMIFSFFLLIFGPFRYSLDKLFFFGNRWVGPNHEIEDNLTWEKLSFSRNSGFPKVEKLS